MNTKKLVIDDATEWQQAETVEHSFIKILVVLANAFINLYLHSFLKLKYDVICLHSWLPRSKWILFGKFILRENRRVTT